MAHIHRFQALLMTQKERAIARVTPPGTTPGRYRPPDTLLAFLEKLLTERLGYADLPDP